MKKTILLLILALALSTTACGMKRDDDFFGENNDTTLVTDTTTETTEIEDTTKPESTSSETTKPEITTRPETTKPETTKPETTVPDTTEKEDPTPDYYKVNNYDDVKAIWLSQFDLTNVYTNSGKQREKADFLSLMETILTNAKTSGFNTIYLQVRPNADSFYPSEYYPSSTYVLGGYGREFSYDPIELVVTLAKEKGFSIHAWINPLRGMTDGQIISVQNRYAVKKWYDSSELNGKYIVKNGSNWYLNPAYGEVRELIVNGAKEALARYEFDGLHMDDYFYPTTSADFDSAAYSSYTSEGGKLSLADWRRDNLNKLIKALYDGTKEVNPDALYGISPAGNWNTVYDNQYADYKTWCAYDGYIDYICPQVYFGLEHQSFDFVKTSKTWQSFIKTDSVKLIIGMTLGKAVSGYDQYAGSGKNEWAEHKNIIKRCIQESLELPKCTGISIFCYQYLYDPITGATVEKTLEEKNNFLPILMSASWKN